MAETLTHDTPFGAPVAPSTAACRTSGLQFTRHFSSVGRHPFDAVQWELRDAVIQDRKGNLVFEQKAVEVPADWSVTATNIVASKYLHGRLGTAERETGVKQLITRVAESIRDWGIRDGYFATPADADTFFAELAHLLVQQKCAFNSPVWFNVGCDRLEPNSDAQNWHWDDARGAVAYATTGYARPQCSACFINSVEDSLDSILTLAKTEGMLFKWGSGAGSNLSTLRGSTETLTGGGTASGPLSFMRGFDAFAGVIKSGGKTRRAAKMVVLNVEHPDIEAFIQCKVVEERKAWALIAAGYDGSGPDSEAFGSIFFQNANNSVRVTDEFMHAVDRNLNFSTRAVKDRQPVKEYRARDLMHAIAEATWQCGDPGMQYDTTINRWHTSKNAGRINASNPCSEYMFLDDSACNLASFNLLKFLTPAGRFDVAGFRHAIGIVTTAMEIIVDAAGYPTERIAQNSHDYRPLGLGYANLGALLMDRGLPYDSDAGRAFAGGITAILSGEAYAQSARIAETCRPLRAATAAARQHGVEGGACPGFGLNREPFLDVIRMHRAEVNKLDKHLRPSRGESSAASSNSTPLPSRGAGDASAATFTDAAGFVAPQLAELKSAAQSAWDEALVLGERFGFRNSQVTVLAPTGTIGFMMDCDTTGIEPDLALVKYKKLVGGGMIKIVNNTVPGALFKLGYADADVQAIVNYIDAMGTIEGAPALKPEHLAVFDCSFKPARGARTIGWLGHVKMMAATQPFLSGAISKTVNLPTDCTVQDIADAYTEAWRLGLKAVAIYRDGSKGTQPLTVSASTEVAETAVAVTEPQRSQTDMKPSQADMTRSEEAAAVAPSLSSHSENVDSPASASTAAALTADLARAQADAETARLKTAEITAQLAIVQTQLNESIRQGTAAHDALNMAAPPRAVRHRLPSERASVTHKFGIGGHEGYVTVGLYPSGAPGEIFIRMAKEGSTISGLMDSFATAVSMCLQHGVPLRLLCEKFAHTRFEPSGWTGNAEIGYAKSIMDYLFRWMQMRFLSGHQLDLFAGLQPAGNAASSPGISPTASPLPASPAAETSSTGAAPTPAPSPAAASSSHGQQPGDASLPAMPPAMPPAPHPVIADDLAARSGVDAAHPGASANPFATGEDRGVYGLPGTSGTGSVFHAAEAMRGFYDMGDAPSCSTCGAIMVRNGACHRCMECGSTSGCS